MQPFPSIPRLNFAVAYPALMGLFLVGSPGVVIQAENVAMTAQGYFMVAASDDDRGSGRLSNQADFHPLVSFRGSGRIHPDPAPAPQETKPDSAPYYRGSGRLG